MTRPFDSRSTVATWPASSHGLRRGSGVSIVPSRSCFVRHAATASATHASTPHTGSQTNKPSQPCSSATAASSPISAASAHGTTKPNFMSTIIALRRGAGSRPSAVHGSQRTQWLLGNYSLGHGFPAARRGRSPPRRRARVARRPPEPTAEQLAEAGYVAPQWPAPWGLGADPIHQLIIDDELSKAKVRRPVNPIGIGWAGPDAALRRHRRAEASLPAADAVRRGVLVPAVQRVRQRQRPRQPRHACRSRRRRVRRQRAEDLDQRRAARGVRHPPRPHRPRRAEAQGHLVLHLPDEGCRASRSARSPR